MAGFLRVLDSGPEGLAGNYSNVIIYPIAELYTYCKPKSSYDVRIVHDFFILYMISLFCLVSSTTSRDPRPFGSCENFQHVSKR